MIEIHPSSLSQDCELRGAVDQWPEMFTKLGYQLRHIRPHIGAVLGTAFHAGIAHLARVDYQHNGTDNQDMIEALAAATIAYTEEEKAAPDGIQYDPITPDRETMAVQLERMIPLYWKLEGSKRQSILVERELRTPYPYNPDFEIVGTVDHFTDQGVLLDLKTGKSEHLHALQLGLYAWLLAWVPVEAHLVQSIIHIFIQRQPLKEQPKRPHVFEYNFDAATTMAIEAVNRTIARVETFIKHQDPGAFAVNPESDLCSPKFCAAFGTELCPISKMKAELRGW